MKTKKLEDQVVVITGASSGIGLATAKMAAQRGARVVLAGRDETSLQEAVDEIRKEGGQAIHAVADVADEAALASVADVAVREYGGFDTWVNNAGVSIYGLIEKVPVEDAKRLFETNYWGVVHGSLVALRHLRARGGVLINIGSVVSDRAIPLQGHYSASKHAVKGFTDALRMEIEKESLPIAVCLVKPSSIATPYPQHAKNFMDSEPTLPPPVYAPEVVAQAILHCAERPMRDITVGSGGGMLAGMGHAMPRMMDRIMEATMFDQQQLPSGDGANQEPLLFDAPPGSGGQERGQLPRHVMESSMYTQAQMHPGATMVALAAIALGAFLTWRST